MKTFTKHILLLALMLFGVAGAAWATPRAPQKFTGPVNIADLVQGDTLAPGFSLICNGESELMFPEGTVKVNGLPHEWVLYLDCSLINNLTYGSNGAMLVGSDAVTPAYGDWQDGNAWVVTSAYFDEYYRVTLSGIYVAPDPYAPALDETTGHWNFLMPGQNKVVKAVLLDSIVVGPHVRVGDLAIEGKYANGTDTVYYYDTNSHPSLTLTAANNDGQGRNFGYWADLDPTDPEYSDYYRYIGPSGFTCGDTFRAVYPENHTLTLTTNGGGTLSLDGVSEETVYTITIGGEQHIVRAADMPYDTTFNYGSANVFLAEVNGQSGKLSIINQGDYTVTIRISGAFEGIGSYACMVVGYNDPDFWDITCTASTVPVTPYGISKTGDNTYSVMEGLTVNVTATPEEGNYLAQWSDQTEPVEGDARLGGSHSFTMPATDATLTATFVQNPLLAISGNDGGTVTLDGVTPGATTYNITIEGGNTYTNVSFPFQTTVFLHEGLEWVDAIDQDPLNVYKDGNNAIIIIDEPYGGGRTITYGCGPDGGHKSIFCTGVPGLPIMPEGVTYAGYDTYLVLPGTQLSVTATPDAAHYLARIDGHDTVGNYACGYSFVMPSNDYPLMADFQAKPTLTLDQTDGGTLEAIVPQGEPVLLTTIIPTATAISTGSQTNDTVTVTVAGDLQWGDGGWIVEYGDGKQGSVSVTAAAGFDIAYYKFYFTDGAPYNVSGETAAVYPFCSGSTEMIFTQPNGQGPFIGTGVVTRIEVYTTVTPNVIASSTPNTYIIDYGTPVTVVATPDSAHYLVSFSDDDPATDRNSNIAVEKTYDSVVANLPLSATFAAKPTLTLAHNDGGEMEIVPAGSSTQFHVPADWNGQDTEYPTTEDLPGFLATTQEEAEALATGVSDNMAIVIYDRHSDGRWYYIHRDNDSYSPHLSNLAKHAFYSIEESGTAIYYTSGVSKSNVIASATPNTYYVDYNTDVTVVATPDATHYLKNFVGGADTNSNIAVNNTFTVTADTTLTATFQAKPVLTLAQTLGGTIELGGYSPAATTYDITIEGDNTYTNVTFPFQATVFLHEGLYDVGAGGQDPLSVVKDGNNAVITISEPYGGTRTVSYMYINNENFFGGNKRISCQSVEGAPTMPKGVVSANATLDTFVVDYGATLTVTATPDSAHYFVNWDEETALNSNTAVEKTLTMGTDDTELTANFSPKPVLTLAANDTTWGKVMLDGAASSSGSGQVNANSLQVGDIIKDATGATGTGYISLQEGRYKMGGTLQNVGFSVEVDQFNSWIATDGYTLNFTDGNLTPVDENGQDGNAWIVLDLGSNGPIIGGYTASGTGSGTTLPEGVVQLDFVTYRVDYGTTLTLQADATELHHVANWVDADSVAYPAADITYSAYFITEPEPLFPDSSTLTITVTADTTARALFGINSYDVTATANLDSRAEVGTGLAMGTVSATYVAQDGTPDQTVSPAANISYTAQGGSQSTLVATANYGYVFDHWTVGTETYTTTTLTLTEAATVTALFVPDTFTVSATPSIAGSATLSGTGEVAYLESATLEATPATGYHFTEWQNLAGTQLGTSATLTVQVMGDTNLVAVMDTNEYNVTFTVQNDDRDEIGTGLPMGIVVLEGRHMHFLNDTLSVVPAYGFLFTGWYEGDVLASEQDTFIFSPTEAVTYEARFLPDTFTVSLTMNDEHAGDVLPHGQLPAGVTVGPNVTYRVPYLVPMTFYGAALEHNHIVNWINENDAEYVDGVTYSDYLVCDTFPTTSFLTLAVTGDTTVKINFLVDYYYVTVGLDEESTGRGTVTGSGYYDHGDTVTAMASPAEGYHFDGWDNGVEISPYAFAAVQDSTILVHFDTNVYSLTVVAETDTNTGLPMGTTLGDGLVKHFLYYDIEAVAEEGYHFVMWTDSVTDNPRTVTLTENTTFTAHFEMDPIVDVVINGVSADETMGTVSGSDTVDYGEEVILTATANEHYHFVQWNDGNSDNPRTVVAAHDSTLTAYFAVNQYAVVGVSADETMGTVSGSDTVDYQSVVVLTATAGDCYHFESWSDGETANPRSIVAEADTTVSALFAATVYSMNDTVTVCDSYEWNGTVYTQSGTYTHDGTTAAGCDMLETLYLTVNASTTAVETVTACDSYEWHDSVYTASTDESTYQTTNAAGCDSTVTLHLTVNAATASEESETACNYYTWHGETYTVSGDYSYTTQNAAGCDSTVTLHLTVNYGNLISIDSTVCDSIVWRGNVYTESGVYDFDLPSESGCFSIETLNLTVNYSSSAVETIFACDSYTWNGLQFDADNHTATYFTVNAVGCDSTVTLDLTVHYSNEGTDNVTACDSVEWHGTVYTASDNTATYSTINAAGCDSTVVLVLTINHSVSDTVEVTAEESYEWNGEVYSQSGTYTYSGTTEAGCDSTVTLLLTITYQPQPVYYTVTLVSADTTMGSVLPAEAMSVEEGSQFSATAIALYGRHFVAWERDGQVVSTDNPYSFEVTEDVELTATFAYNPVTVILSVNNAN